MKTIIFLLSCASVLASEGDIRVFSIDHTNAEHEIYAKDEFTRDGQTNLIRVFQARPGDWRKVCRFYHAGRLVGNFVFWPGQALFNSEAGVYCMSLKYGPAGEILSAQIGDSEGVLLDEFVFTNGTFSPVTGPLRHQGMKPGFGDETKFIKEASEAEARFNKHATGKDGPTSQ